MPLNSIYLSGWEYNRVLADEPADPWPTMLPAEPLWNGGAQFWLFEHVFCTKEAFDAKIRASEALGFASGIIYQDLLDKGFLKLLDWQQFKGEHPKSYEAMCTRHSYLREQYDFERLRALIRAGNTEQLEAIKLTLLSPLLKALNCVKNFSPSSVRHWFPSGAVAERRETAVSLAFRTLASPIANPDNVNSGQHCAGVQESASPTTNGVSNGRKKSAFKLR